MRQGFFVRHSSIWPCSFHKRKSRSTCQRSRSRTKASGKLSRARGTLVTTMVQLARSKTSAEGSRPWAWAALRMRWRRSSATCSPDAYQDQSHRESGLLAQEHSQFAGLSLLLWQEATQLELVARSRVEPRAVLQPHDKKAFAAFTSLGQSTEPPQGKKAQIGEIESPDWQFVVIEGTFVITVSPINQPWPFQLSTQDVPMHK